MPWGRVIKRNTCVGIFNPALQLHAVARDKRPLPSLFYKTVSEQSAGSGLIQRERKEVAIPSTTLVKRVGTGPPPGVRCGRGSPHAFGRSTSRIARRGVPRAHRISPTEIAPRFECRRARSCEVTRPPLDLHSRFLPFTRPRPCSMDRRSSAQTCGLAKEGF